MQEVRAEIEASHKLAEAELGELTARLVDAGLASWAESAGHGSQLIVRGQANLLQDLTAIEDLERIRLLFADLETKKDVIDLLTGPKAVTASAFSSARKTSFFRYPAHQ